MLDKFTVLSNSDIKHRRDDDDGSENITKKVNLLPFKLYRVYLEPLNPSSGRDLSWS